MATILAANTGNWSATGTWTGGVVPVAGDIVVANGKTITMDTLTITVAELRNDTTGGAVAGGTFNLVNGSNITANAYSGTSTSPCITWAGTTGQTATVTGNIYAGTGTSSTGNGAHGISCTGGNLTIGGGSNVYGIPSGNSTSMGISFASNGTFVFCTAGNPGTVTGSVGVNASSYGIGLSTTNGTAIIYASSITSTSTGTGQPLNVAGTNVLLTVVAGTVNSIGSYTSGIYVNATLNAASSITVSGTIYGSNNQQQHAGIYLNGSTTLNIVHSGSCVSQNANNGSAIINGSSAGTINYTGNPVGNSSGSTFASITNSNTGTINITGSVTAGNIGTALNNNSTGIVRVTRAIGNGYGVGSVGINNVLAIGVQNQGAQVFVEQIQFGSLGNTPVGAHIRLTSNTGNAVQFITTTGTTKTLVDTAATSGVLPAASDVRSGVVYSSGNLTGTCAVPSASVVTLGVPVDNTTGTAILNASNIRTAVGMASANLDSQLKDLNNNTIAAGVLV